MKSVRFHDEARLEFVSRVAYYEGIEGGLGERFRKAVENAVALAAFMPDAGSTHKYGTRRVFPKKFPFGIVYSVQPTEIVKFAVAHFKLKPGYWRSRKSDG